jgi:SpoVK/Ycf46/Vps4 family AAA+-type ATPase
MMNSELWEEANSRYLSTALHWLRLRLQRASEDDSKLTGTTRRKSSEKTQVVEDRTSIEAARTPPVAVESFGDFVPSLVILSEALGLSAFETNVLLLCAAPEFDPGISSLYAGCKANHGLHHPTFALAMSIFDDPAWDAISPGRPLRYWKLIEITQPGAQALATSTLRVDERIVGYLKGLNALDDRLAPYLALCVDRHSASDLAPSQRQVVDKIVHNWMRSAEMEPLDVVQLCGSDPISKQTVALNAAAMRGLRLLRLCSESIPTQPAELEAFARLWRRERLLLPVALYVDAQEIDSEAQAAVIRRLLARCDGFLLLSVRETFPRLGRTSFSFEVFKPTREEQKLAWDSNAGFKGSYFAGALAGQFSLNLSDIRQIGKLATPEPGKKKEESRGAVWDACNMRVRPHLDALAQRLEPKATWEDIVLPEEQADLLRQIAAQVNQRSKVYTDWGFGQRMNRGLGINALFAGESGTGKTMAAEVIANDLRLNLYRIDLSAVVSKYIGETEKNLRRLFDAAEDGGAILFFDEADALFGKRSEVRDSHDRHANIEVNYLLQRMEAYCGLAILATNMRSALDVAFTRRLRFIVNFPFPSIADRGRMWRKAFPPQAPVVGLDYDRLARVNLTGGSVHNAAINAAFLAARSGTEVTMGMVLKAIRGELIKMDRAVNEADFRWKETKEEVA